jgi:hypothetical protein
VTDNTDYDRGHREGGQDARMAAYDIHFRDINGSIRDFAKEMGELNSGVTGLRSDIRAILASMEAAERTRIATAAALKEQEEARRDKNTDSWTPLQRGLAVIAALVGVASLAIAWYATHH